MADVTTPTEPQPTASSGGKASRPAAAENGASVSYSAMSAVRAKEVPSGCVRFFRVRDRPVSRRCLRKRSLLLWADQSSFPYGCRRRGTSVPVVVFILSERRLCARRLFILTI